MALQVGAPSPEVSLFNNERQVLTLENFKGQTSVLVFFPGAFTGGCQEEACTFRDSLAQYEGLGAQVYGISVCLLYTSPSPRDGLLSRMPSSA